MLCVVLNFSKAPWPQDINTAHTTQAVFFPIPQNADTMSHPVNAWKMDKRADYPGPIASTILLTAIKRKFEPVPNAIQSSEPDYSDWRL